jgi:nucleoside-diphosphate-sugar epimerase
LIRNKKVFVTGATGFVGSNLVRSFLRQGNEVHVLTRRSSNKWRLDDILKDINECHVDLDDTNGISSVIQAICPDVIVHTAVYGGHAQQKDTKAIFDTNLAGTINLVNACNKIDYELFINTGSSSEYGYKNAPMTESDVCHPGEYYGISKLAATLYCHMMAIKNNKPIITLRLFSPYGYYDDSSRLIPSVILSCLNGRPPALSSSSFVRDFIFIDDVVRAYHSAMKCTQNGAIINIGTGREHNVGDVAEAVTRITGNNLKPVYGHTPKRLNEPIMWEADVHNANELLNWAPEYSLEEGLSKTIEWFRENKPLYDGQVSL